ncbi:MAG: SAM-dependent methyltransferase [Oscillospiraceae bacterium]|nr:SAM-dependent methyltransferase [Oscillospiraceae bacterium]
MLYYKKYDKRKGWSMTPITLTNRLQRVAELVRQDAYFADIGTDHGYLPIYLVQIGRVKRAIAADVNRKPLQQAEQAIQKYSLTEQITPLLSDGLEKIDPTVTDIAIAGMGGELIASILSATAVAKDGKKRFLLQPMTQEEYLRRYLAENGFVTEEEVIAAEGHHLYLILQVRYDGGKRTLTDCEAMVGKCREKTDPLSQRYLRKKADKLQKIAEGLRRSGNLSAAEEQEERMKEILQYCTEQKG